MFRSRLILGALGFISPAVIVYASLPQRQLASERGVKPVFAKGAVTHRRTG